MNVPDLEDLPFAEYLQPHEGELSSADGYDTVLFDRVEFDSPHAPNVSFLECAFRTVAITGGALQRSGLRGVWARDLRLAGTTMAEGSWTDVTVLASVLAGVELFGTELRDVIFSGCKFDSVNLRAARLTGVVFDHCVLRDCDFAGATLTRCAFPGSQLTRVDLSRVTMEATDLRGAELGVIIDTGSLRGATISSAQLALAAPVLAEALGIVVSDDQAEPGQPPARPRRRPAR